MPQYNVINAGLLVSGQPEDISQVLANFNAIRAIINALKDDNIDPTAALGIAKLAGYPADATKVLRGDGTWGSASFAGVRVFNSANTALPNGATTTLPWDSETFDSNAFHDLVTNNNRLTVPAGLAGKYLIVCYVDIQTTASAALDTLILRKNGGGIVQSRRIAGASAYIAHISDVVDLAVGDFIDAAYQNGNATPQSTTGGSGVSWLSMVKVG